MSNRLVFSTDPKDKVNCPRCKKLISDCRCKEDYSDLVDVAKLNPHLRMEKNGRGGKTVSILEFLPRNEKFLNDLCKELKSKCGTGGTYYVESGKDGVIEIQGDKRSQIAKILTSKKLRYRGG